MKNGKIARKILDELSALGVRDFVVCPGGRNAPFVTLLSKVRGARVFHFFDERSASFFALGRAKDHLDPVAIFTTSGTAVAECYPAIIEAYYSSLPLVVVSADRPRRYRGTGAPQTIDQVRIFGSYVEAQWDIEKLEDIRNLRFGRHPVHINVSFEEPLVSAEPLEKFKLSPPLVQASAQRGISPRAKRAVLDFLKESKRPVVIISQLRRDQRAGVMKWLEGTGLPVYAEGLSQCRECTQLSSQNLRSGENLLNWALTSKLSDGVIRIGGVPTARVWRDLEVTLRDIPVLSISEQPWSGLARLPDPAVPLDVLQQEWLSSVRFEWQTKELQSLWDFDQRQSLKLEALLQKYPLAEPAFIRQLSQTISVGAKIYLGNSLPIREWDLAAQTLDREWEVEGNRGANGIDGQLSTYLGWAGKDVDNWSIVGDLTALYDLQALWVTPMLKIRSLQIVVVNNGGGRIFAPMFRDPNFENRHQLQFQDWARQFGWAYQKIEDSRLLEGLKPQPLQVIEVRPDSKSTEKFFEAWAKIWARS